MLALLEIVRINGFIAGAIVTLGLYAQVVKLFRHKSAKDLSLGLIIALLYHELAWLVYGLCLHEWPIVVLSILTLPAAVLIGVGYIKFGDDIHGKYAKRFDD